MKDYMQKIYELKKTNVATTEQVASALDAIEIAIETIVGYHLLEHQEKATINIDASYPAPSIAVTALMQIEERLKKGLL